MSKKTIRRKCHTCRQFRPFSKQRLNHILHFFISLFTGGLWLVIWILKGMLGVFKPYRCEFCGRSKH